MHSVGERMRMTTLCRLVLGLTVSCLVACEHGSVSEQQIRSQEEHVQSFTAKLKEAQKALETLGSEGSNRTHAARVANLQGQLLTLHGHAEPLSKAIALWKSAHGNSTSTLTKNRDVLRAKRERVDDAHDSIVEVLDALSEWSKSSSSDSDSLVFMPPMLSPEEQVAQAGETVRLLNLAPAALRAEARGFYELHKSSLKVSRDTFGRLNTYIYHLRAKQSVELQFNPNKVFPDKILKDLDRWNPAVVDGQ